MAATSAMGVVSVYFLHVVPQNSNEHQCFAGSPHTFYEASHIAFNVLIVETCDHWELSAALFINPWAA